MNYWTLYLTLIGNRVTLKVNKLLIRKVTWSSESRVVIVSVIVLWSGFGFAHLWARDWFIAIIFNFFAALLDFILLPPNLTRVGSFKGMYCFFFFDANFTSIDIVIVGGGGVLTVCIYFFWLQNWFINTQAKEIHKLSSKFNLINYV